jgi:3-hydroxyacyl-[acyl-carrier-protein] dehydratase
MRFYLVDRILDVVPRKRATAWKLVSRLDPVIEQHPVAGPSLATSVVIESLAQISAWLILVTTDFAQRGVLGGFRTITLGRPARVGERLDLLTEVDSWSEDGVVFRVQAARAGDGELVVQIEGALCMMIDAGRLEDTAWTRQHYGMLQSEAPEAEPEAVPVGDAPSAPFTPSCEWAPYDVKLPAAGDGQAAAVKAVAMTDPLFSTHFPHFPTVPGVLLMQSLICLGREVLPAAAPGRYWEPVMLQGVRFQRYIRPGDQLLLQARVNKADEREATVSAEVLVGGQRAVVIRQLRFEARDLPQ